MDKKLKIKYRKKEEKYVIDYNRCRNKKEARYDVIKIINDSCDMMVFIDSSLGMADEKEATSDYYNLKNETSREMLTEFLADNNFEYRFRSRKREETKSILGIAMGSKEIVEDILVAVLIEKGKLTEELFSYLLCSHDYTVGIELTKESNIIFSEFTNEQFLRIDQIEGFNDSLVDSHFLKYFYTSYKIN